MKRGKKRDPVRDGKIGRDSQGNNKKGNNKNNNKS
jgi:hypothetical protein